MARLPVYFHLALPETLIQVGIEAVPFVVFAVGLELSRHVGDAVSQFDRFFVENWVAVKFHPGDSLQGVHRQALLN